MECLSKGVDMRRFDVFMDGPAVEAKTSGMQLNNKKHQRIKMVGDTSKHGLKTG